MKQLLLTLLLVSFSSTSALADSPEAILKDYRKQAAQAVERINQSLEKAAIPLITKLAKDGDAAGACHAADRGVPPPLSTVGNAVSCQAQSGMSAKAQIEVPRACGIRRRHGGVGPCRVSHRAGGIAAAMRAGLHPRLLVEACAPAPFSCCRRYGDHGVFSR